MSISKELVQDWKNHPVTEAVNQAIRNRIEEGRDALEVTNEAETAAVVRGMIRAFRDILDIKFDEEFDEYEI